MKWFIFEYIANEYFLANKIIHKKGKYLVNSRRYNQMNKYAWKTYGTVNISSKNQTFMLVE